jgi:hypothetical protein
VQVTHFVSQLALQFASFVVHVFLHEDGFPLHAETHAL